nr:EcsC family protein [Propionibacterium sp.]
MRGPEVGGSMLRQLLEIAINGVGKVPGAKTIAANALVRAGSVEPAIDSLVSTHVRLATAQGVLTNLGGVWTAPLLLPANIAGLAIVQIRLVASIAHLRGYDVDDPRVRTAMALCILGETGVLGLIDRNEIPTTPLAIATAPVFDSGLDRLIAEKVFGEISSRLMGRQAVVLLARRVPVLGGGVSGAMDGWFTSSVASYARAQFPTRRRLTQGPRPAASDAS